MNRSFRVRTAPLLLCCLVATSAAAFGPPRARFDGRAIPLRVIGAERFFRGARGEAWAVDEAAKVRVVREAAAGTQVWDVAPARGLLVSRPDGLWAEPFSGKPRLLFPVTGANVVDALWTAEGVFFGVELGGGRHLIERRFIDAAGEPRLVATTSVFGSLASNPPRAFGDRVYWMEESGGWVSVRTWKPGDQQPVTLASETNLTLLDADARGAWVKKDPPYLEGPREVWCAGAKEQTLTLFDDVASVRVVGRLIYFSTPHHERSGFFGKSHTWPRYAVVAIGSPPAKAKAIDDFEGNPWPFDLANRRLWISHTISDDSPPKEHTEAFSLSLPLP